MPFREQGWSTTRAEFLMDISGSLGELAQTLELCGEIPGYLSRVLQLDLLTLAIVSDPPEQKPEILLSASSAHADVETPAFKQNLLGIYAQTRPLATHDVPTLRPELGLGKAGNSDIYETSLQAFGAFPRAAVFTRTIDGQHRMLLIVHQRADEARLSAAMQEVLMLIANQLAKLLNCLIVWKLRCVELGAPFNRLTEREWTVLQGMNTEAGEKQLADQLGLSPHTLHSHIKAIYQKVGVKGRIPLLTRTASAMRTLRLNRLNQRPTPPPIHVTEDLEMAVG